MKPKFLFGDIVVAVERLQKEKENTIEAIECSLSGTSERNDWGGLVQAIDTVLKELDTLQMNYKLLEEKFDGSAEEKVDKLTEELDKQKQVKAEMRKVAWEEGYNQGYLAGAMESI